jgi:hypothetical protein
MFTLYCVREQPEVPEIERRRQSGIIHGEYPEKLDTVLTIVLAGQTT